MATNGKDNCPRLIHGWSWYGKRVSGRLISVSLGIVPRHGEDNLGFRTTQSGCCQKILKGGGVTP